MGLLFLFFLYIYFNLITWLPSSRCFLYRLTGTIYHVTVKASGSTNTPLLQNARRGWRPCFQYRLCSDWWKRMCSGVCCHQCLLAHRVRPHHRLQADYSAKYLIWPNLGVSGTRTVTFDDVCLSQPSNQMRTWWWHSHHILMCFCLLFSLVTLLI